MAIVVCPSCGRYNKSEQLAADDDRCEMCQTRILRPPIPAARPEVSAPVPPPPIARIAGVRRPDKIDVTLAAGGDKFWKASAGRIVSATGVAIMFVGFLLAGYSALGKAFGLAGIVGGFVMGFGGEAVRRFGKRFTTLNAEYAASLDPRPPVLLLRRFADDGISAGVRDLAGPITLVPKERITFEELVAEAAAEIGPVVAIGKPGEILPRLGAARTYIGDEDWTNCVEDYLGRAGLVVMFMGRIEGENGLAWELRKIWSTVPPEKIVFVVPPVSEDEARSRWIDFHDRSGGRLPPYQGGELVAGFDADGTCRVVRTSGSRRSIHRSRLREFVVQTCGPVAVLFDARSRSQIADEYRAGVRRFALAAAASADSAPPPALPDVPLEPPQSGIPPSFLGRLRRQFPHTSWKTMLLLFIAMLVGLRFAIMLGLASHVVDTTWWPVGRRDYGMLLATIFACASGGCLMLSVAMALERSVKRFYVIVAGIPCTIMVVSWGLAAVLTGRLAYFAFATSVLGADLRPLYATNDDRPPGTPDRLPFFVDPKEYRRGSINIPVEVIRQLRLKRSDTVGISIDQMRWVEPGLTVDRVREEDWQTRHTLPHEMQSGREIDIRPYPMKLGDGEFIRVVVYRD